LREFKTKKKYFFTSQMMLKISVEIHFAINKPCSRSNQKKGKL